MTSSHRDSKIDLKAHHTTLLQTHIPKKKASCITTITHALEGFFTCLCILGTLYVCICGEYAYV